MYELRPVYPNELYHHGIKNQQWGVQNGPPYPLDSSEHRKVIRGEMKNAAKKQAKAERRENKVALRNAEGNLYKTAYNLYYAKSMAKGANKHADKSAAKAYKSEKHAHKARERANEAAYQNRRADFWQKQYNKQLAEYRNAAGKLGKKAKFNESESSIKRAAGKAMQSSTTSSIVGQAFGGILGNVLLSGAAAIKSSRDIDAYRVAAEQKAGLRRGSMKQSSSSARHNGNLSRSAGNSKQTNVSASPKNATSEKNAIMREIQFRVYGNGARPSQANKEAIADLRNILKTTKGTYNKENGISTYVTPYGIFDIHYGPNGTISSISFDD